MVDLPEIDMTLISVDDGKQPEDVIMSDESSSKEVYEEWSKEKDEDDVVMLVVDDQLGSSDLLDTKIFLRDDPCLSPTSALDDLAFSTKTLFEKDLDLLSYPPQVIVSQSTCTKDPLTPTPTPSPTKKNKASATNKTKPKSKPKETTKTNAEKSSASSDKPKELSLEEQYRQTLQKLTESMQRSQETRKSLQMKTPKTEKYPRRQSVSKVLTSIEQSSKQLQEYLQKHHRLHHIPTQERNSK